ncbi:MAG: gephyrin-like molybdotransferase Glp [Pseudomonadota bacterium]
MARRNLPVTQPVNPRSLMPVAEARALSQVDLPQLGTETIALGDAVGRVLAKVPVAKLTQPPFPASAMDGYALRADDLIDNRAELEIVGESAAGHGYHEQLQPGTCVRIFTGAPLPPAANVIAIQENAQPLSDGRVRILKSEPQGRYIRPAGGDFEKGRELAAVGTRLTPQILALLASAGHTDITVARRPVVAVISTGDELVSPGTIPGPDQIISSNAMGVIARVRAAGGEVIDLGIVADTKEAIEQAFGAALAQGAHVVLTLGGASVGDHDLVKPVFEAMGGELDLYRIAMRPGKPFMVGRLKEADRELRLLGLPGNPISSLVCTKLFVEPLVAKLQGAQIVEGLHLGTLTTPLDANDEREDYTRCTATPRPDGGWDVQPFPKQDSSLLHVAAAANALLCRPAHQKAQPVGAQISFMFW